MEHPVIAIHAMPRSLERNDGKVIGEIMWIGGVQYRRLKLGRYWLNEVRKTKY